MKRCSKCFVFKEISAFSPVTSQCKACKNEAKRLQAQRRRADGLCQTCGAQPKDGLSMCDICLSKSAEKCRRNRKRKLNNTLCIDCGVPRDGGTVRCVSCAAKNAAGNSERRITLGLSGMCQKCGKEESVLGQTTCNTCKIRHTQYSSAQYYARKQENMCVRCEQAIDNGKTYCVVCSKKNIKSTRNWEDRQRQQISEWMISYENTCSMCGIRHDNQVLLVGDHIIRADKHPELRAKRRIIWNLSKKDFDDELPKLQLLCLICHAIKTTAETGHPQRTPHQQKKWDWWVGVRLKRRCEWLGGCAFTGIFETQQPCYFQADHNNVVTKIETISNMVHDPKYSLEECQEELAKCRILCVMHHALHTETQRAKGELPTCKHTRAEMRAEEVRHMEEHLDDEHSVNN